MVVDKLNLFEELMIGDEGLLILLRLGYELDKEKANQVYKVLSDLAVEWKDQEQIPKKAADMIMDIYPAMLSGSGNYSEKVGMEIMDCCDQSYIW
jgi:hypothetical protein